LNYLENKIFYAMIQAKFGDDLNAWLWPKILSDVLDNDEEHLLLGIGSILNHKLPKAKQYTVLGSGWGYGSAPVIDENWNVLCVRGKISCEALGLDSDLGIIDPAYLLQDFITEPVEKKYEVSIIPHAQSLEVGNWQEICDALNVHLIDPRTTDIEKFVSEVRASKKVITEAMHGAIISDCFGVPWLGYSAYSYINGVKWNDWLSVLSHEVELSSIDSLYKGYENQSTSFVFKNEIKLLLRSVNIWKEAWYPPIPRKSNENTKAIIKKQILSIIENGNFFVSDREVVSTQLGKLREKIQSLK